MDQQLKQRVVGAAVITALAAIFVPMLFDDPVDNTGKRINELNIPEIPARLRDSQDVSIPENTNEVISLPAAEPVFSVEDDENATGLQRWYLQAGIFSQRHNALAFRDKLRQQGFVASVAEVKGNDSNFYRVQIGPELSKESAQVSKKRLEKMNGMKSFVFHE